MSRYINSSLINNNLLEKALKEFSTIIPKKFKDIENVGVIAGISGIALFQFYYARLLKDEKHADIGAEIISYCIDKINQGYSYPTYCNGIAGLGWVIQHLEANNFIELDCDELLTPFDDYLVNQMKFDLEKGNYDFLHGAMGYAYYFFKRFKNTKNIHLKNCYQQYIITFIKGLDIFPFNEESTIKWKSYIDTEELNNGHNLGVAHGISGIINFLSRLYQFDEFQKATSSLLNNSVMFLLGKEKKTPGGVSLYPNWVDFNSTPKYDSRVAWCYGCKFL